MVSPKGSDPGLSTALLQYLPSFSFSSLVPWNRTSPFLKMDRVKFTRTSSAVVGTDRFTGVQHMWKTLSLRPKWHPTPYILRPLV